MNHLEKIDNSISMQYFGHLIDFNVAENQIENTDGLIRYLPSNVQGLNLAGNSLRSGNAFNFFERLTALKYLNLSDTNLLIFDANSLKPHRHLISLDVSHNNLSNVNFAIVSNTMDQLRELHASESQIANVSDVIEHLGASIQILDLSRNHIGPIVNASLFQTLTNLTHLNLSGTHLQKFDFETIKTSKWLHTLDISESFEKHRSRSIVTFYTAETHPFEWQ